MNTINRYLIYQAYGSIAIFHELIYSVYSLIEIYQGEPPVQVVVYTDNVPFLQNWLPAWVQYQPLSPETLRAWAGPGQFVHRVKVMMILDCLTHRTGQFLYADSDTVYRQKIDGLYNDIGQGRHVMHLREGLIRRRDSIIFRKVDKALRQHPEFGVTSDVVMYNAGVLGFGSADQPLIQNVLTLTDGLYRVFPKHIVEQLAFSHYLAQAKPVVEAQQAVYHYWNFKEFRQVLQQFFDANAGLPYQVVSPKIRQIDPERLHEPKRAYEALPFWRKAIRKLRKPRWHLPAYTLS